MHKNVFFGAALVSILFQFACGDHKDPAAPSNSTTTKDELLGDWLNAVDVENDPRSDGTVSVNFDPSFKFSDNRLTFKQRCIVYGLGVNKSYTVETSAAIMYQNQGFAVTEEGSATLEMETTQGITMDCKAELNKGEYRLDKSLDGKIILTAPEGRQYFLKRAPSA
jgi:hypothetical protein